MGIKHGFNMPTHKHKQQTTREGLCMAKVRLFSGQYEKASNCAAAKPAAQETSPRFRRMEMDLDVQHTYNTCFQCLIATQQFAYGVRCVENMCFNFWNSQF